MTFTVISESVRLAIDRANRLAAETGHEHMDTVHLLFGLLVDDAAMSTLLLTNLEVDVGALRSEIDQCVRGIRDNEAIELPSSQPRSKRSIDSAFALAASMQHACVECDHVLLGLLQESESMAGQLLDRHDVNFDVAIVEFLKRRGTEC
jgi:ATP-dependent Clp protease ATP-binding subunit ClpC